MKSVKRGVGASTPWNRRRSPKQSTGGDRRESAETAMLGETVRPSEVLSDYEAVARLVTPEPPMWLLEALRDWAAAFRFGERMYGQHMSRAEMRETLREVERAARFIRDCLLNSDVLLFLMAAGDGPIDNYTSFHVGLRDLMIRAGCAGASPLLATSYGRAKPGRGPALPPGATDPRCFCSLVIAEVWRWFHGVYPSPTNMRAAEAAEKIWALSGNARRSWGNEPRNAWRPYFEDVQSSSFEPLRDAVIQLIQRREARASSPTTADETGKE